MLQSIFTEYRRKVESGEEDVKGNNEDVRFFEILNVYAAGIRSILSKSLPDTSLLNKVLFINHLLLLYSHYFAYFSLY